MKSMFRLMGMGLLLASCGGNSAPQDPGQGEENLNPMEIRRSKDPQGTSGPSNEDYSSLPGGLSTAPLGSFQGHLLFTQGKPFIYRGDTLLSGDDKIKNGTLVESGDLVFCPAGAALEMQITGPGLSDGAIRLGEVSQVVLREGQRDGLRHLEMDLGTGRANFNVFPDFLWTPFYIYTEDLTLLAKSNAFSLYVNPLGSFLATCKEGTLQVNHRLAVLSAKEGTVVRFDPELGLGTYKIISQKLQSFQDKWIQVTEGDFLAGAQNSAGPWFQKYQDNLPILLQGVLDLAPLIQAWEKDPSALGARQAVLQLRALEIPLEQFSAGFLGLWALSQKDPKTLKEPVKTLVNQWKERSQEGLKAWGTLSRWQSRYLGNLGPRWGQYMVNRGTPNPYPQKRSD